ncbi:hypothetical protein M430DRAFT_21032 [Amorphotheca resinae ATCC 22711]|jgi:hypothetical protein|uniref:Uncharacterized protein n=1 Tax=Amorphotheca resinae ATCC 22711 TaxID=857342 RepID=A0A2T3AWT8_AMORE|nr:hypothetical protein M430DRAFT_21032 [Amorphotheca resinae ATCC 22711]PSS13123.1 hypothetical protein M430DRAFT_21032 [Amorphotheca resinae ATCC 22711]
MNHAHEATAAAVAGQKTLDKAMHEAKPRKVDERCEATRMKIRAEAVHLWEELVSRQAGERTMMEQEHAKQIAELKSDIVNRSLNAENDANSKNLGIEEGSQRERPPLDTYTASRETAKRFRGSDYSTNLSTPASFYNIDKHRSRADPDGDTTSGTTKASQAINQDKSDQTRPRHSSFSTDEDIWGSSSHRRSVGGALPSTHSQIDQYYQKDSLVVAPKIPKCARQRHSDHLVESSPYLPTNRAQYDGYQPSSSAGTSSKGFTATIFDSLTPPDHLLPTSTTGIRREDQNSLRNPTSASTIPILRSVSLASRKSESGSSVDRPRNEPGFSEESTPASATIQTHHKLRRDSTPCPERTRSFKRSRSETPPSGEETETISTIMPRVHSHTFSRKASGSEPRKTPKARGGVQLDKFRFETKMLSYGPSEASNQLPITWRNGIQLQLNYMKQIFEPYQGIEKQTSICRDMVLNGTWDGKVFYHSESARFEIYRKNGARLRILFKNKAELDDFMRYFKPNFKDRVTSIEERCVHLILTIFLNPLIACTKLTSFFHSLVLFLLVWITFVWRELSRIQACYNDFYKWW